MCFITALNKEINKNSSVLLYAALSLILLFVLTQIQGCGVNSAADISTYANTSIRIEGLTDEPFDITPDELQKLECVTKSVTGKTEKAGKVTATGPTLNTFLASYGQVLSDYDRIRVTASDNYTKVFMADALSDREMILAVSSGGEPLSESEAPLRILPEGYDSDYWVRMVTKIEFYK